MRAKSSIPESERNKLYCKTYFQRNKESGKERTKRNNKKYIENLSDAYIKTKLNMFGDVPQELIETKRLIIKIHRLCQQQPKPLKR